MLLIGAVLIVVGLALGLSGPLLSRPAVAAIVVLTLGLGAVSASSASPCIEESKYHCLSIEQDPHRPSGYELILDDAHNSYVDLKDPTFLKYRYTRWIAHAINVRYKGREPLDVLFVGGGGFTLPRWLLATRPGSDAHVLEVDGDIVALDRERLGLRTSPHLRATIGDAFSGYTIPWHLTTVEWTEEVKRVLRPGGLFAINLIDHEPLDFLKAEVATLMQTFKVVNMISPAYVGRVPTGGNVILVASERPLPNLASRMGLETEGLYDFPQGELEALVGGAEPLRDDFAPVDQLRTTE